MYPLHVAAGAGAISSCRIMLENGANANVTDKNGLTPLSWAVQGPNATPALITLMRRYGCRFPSIASARARETNAAASAGKIHQLKLYRLAGLSLEVSLDGVPEFQLNYLFLKDTWFHFRNLTLRAEHRCTLQWRIIKQILSDI